ncbi:MAG: DUF2196 domain-containing protein [Epsilonproteobacteria bacterium]|nr:DUF2196 domain-containing protein [Campylobacterota bacterium]
MNDGKQRVNIKAGLKISIVLKADQKSGDVGRVQVIHP